MNNFDLDAESADELRARQERDAKRARQRELIQKGLARRLVSKPIDTTYAMPGMEQFADLINLPIPRT